MNASGASYSCPMAGLRNDAQLQCRAQPAQNGDPVFELVIRDLITLAPDGVHRNAKLRERFRQWPLLDDGRAVEPRMGHVPFLHRERQCIDSCGIGDDRSLEIRAMRLHARFAGFVANTLVNHRRVGADETAGPRSVSERTRAPWSSAMCPPTEAPKEKPTRSYEACAPRSWSMPAATIWLIDVIDGGDGGSADSPSPGKSGAITRRVGLNAGIV